MSIHYGFGLVPISNSYPMSQVSDELINPKDQNRNLNISVAYMFWKPSRHKK
jgi:hypothetical protein